MIGAIQEFSEANSLKRTTLRELILKFQSLFLALISPARKTGFRISLLKHSERSALKKQCSGGKQTTTSLIDLPPMFAQIMVPYTCWRLETGMT